MHAARPPTLLINAANLRSQNKSHALKFKIAVFSRNQVFPQFGQPCGMGKVGAGQKGDPLGLGPCSHVDQGQVFAARVGETGVKV